MTPATSAPPRFFSYWPSRSRSFRSRRSERTTRDEPAVAELYLSAAGYAEVTSAAPEAAARSASCEAFRNDTLWQSLSRDMIYRTTMGDPTRDDEHRAVLRAVGSRLPRGTLRYLPTAHPRGTRLSRAIGHLGCLEL